jgi:hypothetical protein
MLCPEKFLYFRKNYDMSEKFLYVRENYCVFGKCLVCPGKFSSTPRPPARHQFLG